MTPYLMNHSFVEVMAAAKTDYAGRSMEKRMAYKTIGGPKSLFEPAIVIKLDERERSMKEGGGTEITDLDQLRKTMKRKKNKRNKKSKKFPAR